MTTRGEPKKDGAPMAPMTWSTLDSRASNQVVLEPPGSDLLATASAASRASSRSGPWMNAITETSPLSRRARGRVQERRVGLTRLCREQRSLEPALAGGRLSTKNALAPVSGSRRSLCWLKTANATRTPQDRPPREYHPLGGRTSFLSVQRVDVGGNQTSPIRPDFIGRAEGWRRTMAACDRGRL